MKKILKRVGIAVGSLIIIAFLAFLYLIPPFNLLPPEEFARQTIEAPPSLDHISDPAERAIAEHGRYLATTFDCSGCHTPAGDQGPNWSEYLAGGGKASFRAHQTYVTRNLTSDVETGLARRTNQQVMRVLRAGLLPEGRVAYYRDMPWVGTANLTEEDRYAILVYLRQLKPVYHVIADPTPAEAPDDTTSLETLNLLEYAGHREKK